jgi:hypothetical protein
VAEQLVARRTNLLKTVHEFTCALWHRILREDKGDQVGNGVEKNLELVLHLLIGHVQVSEMEPVVAQVVHAKQEVGNQLVFRADNVVLCELPVTLKVLDS